MILAALHGSLAKVVSDDSTLLAAVQRVSFAPKAKSKAFAVHTTRCSGEWAMVIGSPKNSDGPDYNPGIAPDCVYETAYFLHRKAKAWRVFATLTEPFDGLDTSLRGAVDLTSLRTAGVPRALLESNPSDGLLAYLPAGYWRFVLYSSPDAKTIVQTVADEAFWQAVARNQGRSLKYLERSYIVFRPQLRS